MDISQLFHDLIFDYTLRNVAIGSGLLGMISGMIGVFAFIRRQSLIGDAVSHAALPGIVIAYMLTLEKNPFILLIGAAIAGYLGILAVMNIVSNTRIKYDSALGLILSVSFGLGLLLLTQLQNNPHASQAGLDKFLFGQAAAMIEKDIITMISFGGIALFILFLFWKEFFMLSFDKDFGEVLGFPVKLLDFILTLLIVIGVVIGLQTVGVVLMSAMLVAPAAAARQWTDNLKTHVILAGIFGGISGIIGAMISSIAPKIPTGPVIVIVISVILLISFLFSTKRGFVYIYLRNKNNKKNIEMDTLILNMYQLECQHKKKECFHSLDVIGMMSKADKNIKKIIFDAIEKDLIISNPKGEYRLTQKGIEKALLNVKGGDYR